MTIEQLEQIAKIALPEAYKQFLRENTGPQERQYATEADLEYAEEENSGRPWMFYTLSEAAPYGLCQPIEMFRVGNALQCKILDLFAIIAKEFNTIDGFAFDAKRKIISYERISKALVIGTENGDYLYIDADDNNSIWAYYHDGGDVEKLANSFEELLAKSKPV